MNNRLLSDTKIIKIGEAEFSIGIITGKIWNKIQSRWGRGMLSFKKLPESISKDDFIKMTDEERVESVLEGMSPEEIEKANELLFDAHWDMVKYGVRSHSNIKGNDDKEIVAEKDDGGVLSDKTIDLYRINGFFTGLASAVRQFNTVSEIEQKN